MSDPFEFFGLSCPGGGKFYICDKTPTEFFGCCTSDPCQNDGECPDDGLRAASFNGDSYEDMPQQNCSSSGGVEDWYTCAFTTPPYLGCCSENACNSGCPRDSVIAAQLSDSENNRLNFLNPEGDDDATSTSKTSSATATATSTDSSTATAEPSSGGGLGTGATAGIAVGASVAGLAFIAFLIWMFWWKPRQRKQSGQEFQSVPPMNQQPYDTPGGYNNQGALGPQSPMSNYQASFASTPTATPYYPSGVSSMDQYQKYSPQPSQFERPQSYGHFSDNGSIPPNSPGYAHQQQYAGPQMVAVQEMDGTPMHAQELGTGQEHDIPHSQSPKPGNEGLGISK
ncbi:hypothetical protein FZEAL_7349 [Fusarium zealandicum]|uniref:Uncharacterized protein n=1 Tax=Fusarium zealandicum TaxID=1053134 RepID=A0A8H4UG48_9HYPO|nr:hypothetical protein FZEAL_7349 [Fusarium zealandicum]